METLRIYFYLLFSILIMGAFYVFGYLPNRAARELEQICQNFAQGNPVPNLSQMDISKDIRVYSPPSSESNAGEIVFSGGWMTTCSVVYEHGKIVRAIYLRD